MPTPTTLSTTDTVAVLLATGFEEVEALAVVDALYRAGIRADLISIETSVTLSAHTESSSFPTSCLRMRIWPPTLWSSCLVVCPELLG